MFGKEGFKELLKNRTVKEAIGAFAKDYAGALTFETLTEIAQQGLQIIARESAKEWDNEKRGTRFEAATSE